ncbi:MAG: hypothetical protein WDN06_02530 [Asticcacaulis sp.]
MQLASPGHRRTGPGRHDRQGRQPLRQALRLGHSPVDHQRPSSGLSNGSSTIVIGSSSQASGVIGDALSNDAKIPPTIKVPQGAAIEVFAARDLDFALGN